MTFNRKLGLEPGDDPQTVKLVTRPDHEVMPGTIHFAVLATTAEVAAASAAESAVVPASVHLSLLRRAVPGTLIGRGKLIRRGRTVTVCEGEVEQDGKLVAKATVHFAVMS
ncbi:MAG: PaaI family thioesterase [Acidobacteriota bacterium]